MPDAEMKFTNTMNHLKKELIGEDYGMTATSYDNDNIEIKIRKTPYSPNLRSSVVSVWGSAFVCCLCFSLSENSLDPVLCLAAAR